MKSRLSQLGGESDSQGEDQCGLSRKIRYDWHKLQGPFGWKNIRKVVTKASERWQGVGVGRRKAMHWGTRLASSHSAPTVFQALCWLLSRQASLRAHT